MGLALWLVWACTAAPELAEVQEPAAPPPRRPDVVWVVTCTLRADQTGPYGAPPEVTPWLDAFAAAGARTARTISTAPWTRPAIGTLFTGQTPEAIGLADPGPELSTRGLPEVVETLPERFAAAGYRTLGVTANGNVRRTFGFGQGFDTWVAPDTATSPPPGEDVVDQALAMVGQRPDRPTLLTMVLVDAHRPGNATDDEIRAQQRAGAKPMIARYRAQLRHLDRALARLDAGLAERGYDPDETLWVVVGDHGEGLRTPPHHGPGHGTVLFDTSLHVPWLVRGPTIARGHVVEGLSSSLDVAPTLATLAGLEPLGTGQDLASRLQGDATPTGRAQAWASTWHTAYERAAVFTDDGTFCSWDFDPEAAAALEASRPAIPGALAGPHFAQSGCTNLHTDPLAKKLVQPHPLLDSLLDHHTHQRQVLQQAPRRIVDPDEAVEKALREMGYID